ncbi:MAG: AEC family transporter [Clostridia bacterium]
MILIVLMIVVGFVAGKLKFMKSEHKGFLVKYLINFAVPAMCVSNVFKQFAQIYWVDLLKLMLIPLLSMTATFLIALVLVRIFKIEHKKYGPFVVMCAFSNSIFMGLPICKELFGETAVPYVIIFYIFNTLLFWTIGVAMIQRSGDMKNEKPTPLSFMKRLITPPLVALIVSLALLLFNISLPEVVITFCDYLGNTVSPLALMYVGFIIYETDLRRFKFEKSFIAVMLMRFLVAPFITVLLAKLFLIQNMATNVFTIEAAMPVMTQCVIMSAASGADEQYSASAMTLSTLLSFVAVPLIMFALQYV